MYSSIQNLRVPSRRFGAFLISGALVAGLGWMSPAAATHLEGVEYDGNPSCAEAAPAWVTWEEFKLEAGALKNGGHKDPNSDVVITITNVSPRVFDWASNFDLVAVLVKATRGGLRYDYPAAADYEDTRLHGPTLDGGELTGLYHDISHVRFCFAEPVVVPKTPRLETLQPVLAQLVVTPPTPEVAQPTPEVAEEQPAATVAGETLVLGVTLVDGDTLPRTGATAMQTLVLFGSLGLALGLVLLILASRKPANSRDSASF